MAAAFHLIFQLLHEMHKARKGPLVTSPYLGPWLLITIISNMAAAAAAAQNATAPSAIHIGSLVSYDSFIGRVARTAIQMAVDDVNKAKNLLNGSELVLHMLDTNCSAFTGAAVATELLEQEVVAVIGPQSATVAGFVSQMGAATQVPLLSFAVTDPTFSEQEYPYFLRIAHSDAVQMRAIGSLVAMYGWREVVAIHVDDDCGRSGAAALGDALKPLGINVLKEVGIRADSNRTSIDYILNDLSTMESRVFIVHMPQNLSLVFFSEARYQGMMTNGFVWITSDLMIGTLSLSMVDVSIMTTLQGVVGIRGYYAQESPEFKAFSYEWKNQTSSKDAPLIYGLYAYDAVWMLAYAIDSYIKDGYNITFENSTFPALAPGGSIDLARLRAFQGGPSLRNLILQTQFAGTSGYIQLDPRGDLICSAFEIVNIVGGEINVVGYWINGTGISSSPPGNSTSAANSGGSPSSSLPILWPGNSKEVPRGWVLPKNGRPLYIAVPWKKGFDQFLGWSKANSTSPVEFRGFVIDVFLEALKYVPYSVPYTFELFGNGTEPVYDDMIELLAEKMFDAVVGDVVITGKRMEIVDFSQSFKDSGLVVVVPIKDISNPWAFLGPFTPTMWFTTLAFFIFTGFVIWLLEHKKNRDFRGHPSKQAVTLLWFTFSTLFFSQRERTKSTFGRFVVLVWLFVVLIITSSYTANLTSILTVQQLNPSIGGISSLQSSNDPIGYHNGSFVKTQLIGMNIASERLVPLASMEAFAEALTLGPKKGGVTAIVEELPFVEIFLETHCGFTQAGDSFTKSGWGFAFPKGSQLAIDVSAAIVKLSEDGTLKKIEELWLSTGNCTQESASVQLNLSSFWGLFLLTGTTSGVSLVAYLTRLLLQFIRQQSEPLKLTGPGRTRRRTFIRSFASYVKESSMTRDRKREPDDGGEQEEEQSVAPPQVGGPHR